MQPFYHLNVAAFKGVRSGGFDDKIIAMYARGMSVRETRGHLKEIYGVEISPNLISRVTDAVLEDIKAWQNRGLDVVCPVVIFDALMVKIRDHGIVKNKAVYLALAIRADGKREGLRLSLAGAQSKIPVVLVNGKIALPAPGEATSHILKPPIDRFSGTTEIEAFAMRLAKKIGLSVANVEIRSAGNRSFLLVERYDRIRGEDGVLQRMHQEDFCQALGYTSDRKYVADGGPIFRDCFDLLRRAATRPAVEVLKLFDAAIFNLIIGNADAHAKNFSLLYHESSAIELAPLYDLLCTVYYPELSPRLAMKIAKRHILEELNSSDWEKFADETGLALRFSRTRTGELKDLVSKSISETKAEILESASDRNAVEEISSLISARASSFKRCIS